MQIEVCFTMKHWRLFGVRRLDAAFTSIAMIETKAASSRRTPKRLPSGALDFDSESFEFAIEGRSWETKNLRTPPDVA